MIIVRGGRKRREPQRWVTPEEPIAVPEVDQASRYARHTDLKLAKKKGIPLYGMVRKYRGNKVTVNGIAVTSFQWED
jgi:hypothetical protein